MSSASEFKEVLDLISEIVQKYESGEYLSEEALKQMHRLLSSNLYYLNEFRVGYKEQWDHVYKNSPEKTNAAKERYADQEVPELYMTRKLYDAGKEVLISIAINLK